MRRGRPTPAETGTLAAIRRRFTRPEGAVERAFERSETFRSLCRDYLTCTTALARWQQSAAEGAPLRVQEYAELLGELTRDIEALLDAEDGGKR